MSRWHPTAQKKNTQTTVHTIIWASICVLQVSHHHDGHKWPPWTTNRGSEQVSSPPCMFFFLFFLTNMNFELNRLCHSHLTPPPATPWWVDHVNARWHYTVQGLGWGRPCTRISQSKFIQIKITLVNHLKKSLPEQFWFEWNLIEIYMYRVRLWPGPRTV